jgi:hypothetical protein
MLREMRIYGSESVYSRSDKWGWAENFVDLAGALVISSNILLCIRHSDLRLDTG